MTLSLLPLAAAFAVALAATVPLRVVAVRLGIMDHPGHHKSHQEPTPYLGGVAMMFGVAAGVAVGGRQFWAVGVLLGLIALLGLVDDVWNAGPGQRLLVEFILAAAAIGLGFSWHLTDSPILNACITAVWMVGLANAFNLLDNMDGLSSTVAAASLLGLALLVPAAAPLALSIGGAAIGFLVINRPPARMYMGDAGSLMLGFGAAICSVAAANQGRGLHSVVLLVLPVGVAVFDTSLVVVSRLASGRPVQLGGRDHFSHRLLLLGWSRQRVLIGALIASSAGSAAALLADRYPSGDAWLGLPIVAACAVVWLWLLKIDPYRARVNPHLEVHGAQ